MTRDRRTVHDIYPLSPMQEGMLFHALSAPRTPLYLQQYVLELRGTTPPELADACENLVRRHGALRTGFVWEGVERPLQVVFTTVPTPLTVEDVRGHPDHDTLVERVLAAHRSEPFDVRHPPLLRIHALRIEARQWLLVVAHHHIVLDGWSVPTIHAELVELIRARQDGRPAALSPARPFGEFIHWLQTHANDGEPFWKDTLGPVTAPTPLGVDRVGRVSPPAGGSATGRVVVLRATASGANLAGQARRHALLPSTIVHAAWGLLLARYSEGLDATFGVTVAGRPAELPDVQRRVGMFVNTLPLRVCCPDGATVPEWLRTVQRDLGRLRDHEQTPLAVARRCSSVPPNRPLYETVLAFQNYWHAGMDEHGRVDGVSLRVLRSVERTSVPVAVAVAQPDEGLWVRLDYDSDRLDRPAAETMVEHYLDLVEAILTCLAEQRDTPLGELRLSTEPPPAPAYRADDRSQTRPDRQLPPTAAGPWNGLDPAALREAATAVGAGLALRPGDRAVLALADDDPALAPLLIALGHAGVRAHVRPPDDTSPVGEVDLLVGPPRIVHRLAAASRPGTVMYAGDDPAVTLDAPGVLRLFTVPGFCSIARLTGSGDAGRVAPAGRGYVADRHGRRVPDGVEGELVIGVPAGPIRTRLTARLRADGDVDIIGSADTSAWLARSLTSHPDIVDAVVVRQPDATLVAWVVPGPGSRLTVDQVSIHIGRLVPPELAPDGFELVDALPLDARGHVNRAALVADGPVPQRSRPTPMRDRLAALPAERRARFLAAIATIADRGPRPRHADAQAWPSAQQEQWDALSLRVLCGVAEAHTDLPAPPSAEAITAALRQVEARHSLPEGGGAAGFTGIRATAAPDPDGGGHRITVAADARVADADTAATIAAEIVSLLSGRPLSPAPALSYADYAAWQRGPRRHAEREAQLNTWRTILAGAVALGLPSDRVPAGAVGTAVQRRTVTGPTPDSVTWIAAVLAVLARRARADDVVIGALIRPELHGSLRTTAGPFARMLPVRAPVDAGQPVGVLRAVVAEAVAIASRNADVAWTDLRPLLAEDPVIAVAVHTDGLDRTAPHAGVSLALDVHCGAATTLTARYDRSMWHPATIRAILAEVDAYASMEPSRTVADADPVTPSVRDAVLAWGNGGASAIAGSTTIHEMIAARTAQDPDAMAVDGPDGTLTYHELISRAHHLACWLTARGVGVEDRVAVCVPRGTAMVWAALGVLAAAAVYVPVDPAWPPDRVDFLLRDAGIVAVVTTVALREKFATVAAVATVDADPTNAEPVPNGQVIALPCADDRAAAYVLYTSGSTGRPKGVIVEHRSVVNFVRNIARSYAIDRSTRLLGFASLTFDISVFDIWTALTAGATLVLASDDERLSVDQLQRLLEDKHVNVAELPPSLMPLLHQHRLPDLRLVSVGGEAPPAALIDTWAVAGRQVWNGYGPTETTVAVTLMRCETPSAGRIPPIGRPMTNHRVYVVDEALRLVPPGVPGELCVSGTGLARGYFGGAGITAERFVPDPFAVAPGERMYRTGDLVRWTGDQVLEFLGRVDRQVKVRGFRVELGEIEAALAADTRIDQVVVEPRDDESGVRHLVAYVVTRQAVDLAALRDIAAHRLPDYMLPTRMARLDSLPLTAHGKVDRRALAALPVSDTRPVESEPASAIERSIVTDIVAPLLGVAAVGLSDDFFALGGNSLQATQVTSRVRDRFAVEVALADFFADPTARRLAQMVEAALRQRDQEQVSLLSGGPADDDVDAPAPLSFPQERMWILDQMEPGHPAHHAPLALRLTGTLDLAALRGAVQLVVDRHAPLRATFTATEQVFHRQVSIPFDLVDTDEQAVRRLIRQEAERPFDLRSGPMMRATLYRLAERDHVLQWNVHHIVTDGWSIGVMMQEIFLAYNALCARRQPALEPLPAHYRDFVRAQRDYVTSPAYAVELAWWRSKLTGLGSHPALITDHPRGAPFVIGWRNMRLTAQESATALDTARRHGVTPFMLTLAAWSVVMAADGGWDEIAMVTPIAGRLRTEWEPLIGYFVNRVLVRVGLDAGSRIGDLLTRLRAETAAAFSHQQVPFESLIRDLGVPANAAALNFSIQNAPQSREGLTGLRISVMTDDTGRDFTPIMELYSPIGRRFEVSMMLRQRPDGLAGGLEYNAALFAPVRAERWAAGFQAVLARVAAKPDVTVSELRRVALTARY